MKTLIGICVAVNALGLLSACGKGDHERRESEAQAGAPAAGSPSASDDEPDASVGSTGGASPMSDTPDASAEEQPTLGAVLEFVPGEGEVPYALGENNYGITGGAFLARSPMGNTITIADEPGKLCISGNLEEVPDGDYSGYWGVEIGFNLNQGIATASGTSGADSVDGGLVAGDADAGVGPDGGLVADAGLLGDRAPSADAGSPTGGTDGGGMAADASTPEVAQPWLPGKVIGFSYVIEGPTIDLIRFKALPAGYDPSLESSVFCKSVEAISGETENSLFSELRQYCWDTASTTVVPTEDGLANISWQLPADVGVGERPFEWCLSELRPILAE